MKVNVSGHHIEITEAMQAYVEDKMSKLDRHTDNVTNSRVVLTVEKGRMMAEVTIHISGADINASSEDDDMYVAIDHMFDKLERQVLKHKEKQIARNHGQN